MPIKVNELAITPFPLTKMNPSCSTIKNILSADIPTM
jgi:hypothetical protein